MSNRMRNSSQTARWFVAAFVFSAVATGLTCDLLGLLCLNRPTRTMAETQHEQARLALSELDVPRVAVSSVFVHGEPLSLLPLAAPSFQESSQKLADRYETRLAKAVAIASMTALSSPISGTSDVSAHRDSLARSLAAASASSSTVGDGSVKACPAPIEVLTSRHYFGSILTRENKSSGLEIGVREGDFARILLSRWHTVREYHCVDVWAKQEHYEDFANSDNAVQEQRYQLTRKRLAPYERAGVDVRYYRMFSTEAASHIPDDSLDFAYHDARHDYAGLLSDLVLYWPKMRRGAIVAGHDYLDNADLREHVRSQWGFQDWAVNADGSRTPGEKAVRSAVNEFAAAMGRQVVVVTHELDWPTWYIRK
eukprot:TRINITY_DN7816_c0_g1_i1.p1 TRINITY_DN7816_c0_g1~~TRINITY_DN7816_c0_g1_i1.p1  ORF type:complete len:367 (+),score=54.88 TRINITY_DN7816_c0_g1_i1:56-1156(+)